jgi:multicomponent Na+:H+ antiporter subunit E
MQRIVAALGLLALYIALTGNLTLSNIVVGAVVAALITALLPIRAQPFDLRRLVVALGAAIFYVGVLILDVVKNGIIMGRIILHPRLPIDPGIVAIPACCQSELATALSAHAMTVSPGELVIGIDAVGVMYTHILDVSNEAEYTANASSQRQTLLRRIFP